jgi:hypothetical protein
MDLRHEIALASSRLSILGELDNGVKRGRKGKRVRHPCLDASFRGRADIRKAVRENQSSF